MEVNPGNKGGRYDDNDGGKAQANCGKLILYDREVNKKVNNIRYLFEKRWGWVEELAMFCWGVRFIWNWAVGK